MAMAAVDHCLYRIQPAFLEILEKGGAKGELFTISQVLLFLKEYIRTNMLYDLKDPKTVHCEKDPLGKAFGVQMFTVDEVIKLVLGNMQLEVNATLPKIPDIVSSHNGWPIEKRRLSDDPGNDASSKRFRGDAAVSRPWSPMYLELGTSPVYDSSAETVLSFQGYETSLAKDESDDLWYLEEGTDSDDISVELEVMSLTSSCHDDCSDTNDSFIAEFCDGEILIGCNDSDVEFWADMSDCDEYSSDPDLSDADKWKCQHCNAFNKPLVRHCQKCWQVRQGWVAGKKKRLRVPRRKRRRATEFTLEGLRKVAIGMFDSPEPSTSAADGDAKREDDAQKEDAQCENGPADGQTLQRSVSMDSSLLGSCTVCLSRPKDATLVHGRTGHQMSCYPCGKKLWERQKPCPICRRRINKVIKNFIVN